MQVININTDEIVKFTNKLERLRSKLLPHAIRNSVNRTAFDNKSVTMLDQARKQFIQRSSSFFKANSRVEKATGVVINRIVATVGFVPNGQQAIDDLEQQEYGGRIHGRAFIPKNAARSGKNPNKLIPKRNQVSKLKFNAKRVQKGGKKRKQQFIKTVHRLGSGKKIIYGAVVYNIRRASKNRIKLDAIYTYQKNRSVKIKSTGFMRKSSVISAKKMNSFYIKEVEKQIKRLRK